MRVHISVLPLLNPPGAGGRLKRHEQLSFGRGPLPRADVCDPNLEPAYANGEIRMRAMRAESFVGYGGLKLVEVPKPRRTDGRVLVRITAAGVTPLDHTILSGGYSRATAPLILGNEGAGGGEGPGDPVVLGGGRVLWQLH